MSVALLLALGLSGCDVRVIGEAAPGPVATSVVWTEGGVAEPLSDALVGLASVSDASGACEPIERLMLISEPDERLLWLDLAEYIDGAEPITPEPPFLERGPTLVRPETGPGSDAVFISGGPASFALDAAGTHTLVLEAPTRCRGGRWSVTSAECEASDPVSVSFVANLQPFRCQVAATGSEGTSPSGSNWCLTDQAAVGSCAEP